jgi:hypothetical protein
MMKRLGKWWVWMVAAILWMPSLAMAADEGANELVCVADTRVVSGVEKYFADLYNFNILMFAIWAVVLTAAYGSFLGWLMDAIMSRTGLDLRSRKIVEH